MASETRPGVIVVQELSETPAAVSAPTLVPVAVGPCYQIVEALDSDGALNSDAQYADEQYNQVALAIPQADLPDPRSNLDEVNVDEEQVGVRLYFGGLLTSLARGSNNSTGSSFLKSVNLSASPAIVTDEMNAPFSFDADAGDILVIAFDIPSPAITSNDVYVTLQGDMTVSEVADAINGGVGVDVAEVVDEDNAYGIPVTSGFERVLIKSASVGATASVTLRANAAAVGVLFTTPALDTTKTHHIEGAGFRGQDDDDGDLVTPWIEWHRGAYKFGTEGTALTENTGDAFSVFSGVGLIDLDGDFSNSQATDVQFTGSAALVPLSAATATTDGDEFWADGSQVASGVVTVVEKRRFKVGTLNTSLSTFDEDGNTTSAVYTTVEVNTPSHGTPFAPKYSYFIANNLVYGEVTPEGEAAAVTGSETGLSATGATVYTDQVSSAWLTVWAGPGDVLMAGGTLTVQLTLDGVQQDEETFNFSEGSFAGAYNSLTEVATDLTAGLTGISVSAIASTAGSSEPDRLVFTTDASGSDQSLSIKTTGTNSLAANLGISATLSADGKDVEFAEQAEIIGEYITLPLPKSQATQVVLTVTDSFGAHEFALDGVATTEADLEALGDVLTGETHTDGVWPIYIFNAGAGLQVATLHFEDSDGDIITDHTSNPASGRAVFTAAQGGESVSIDLFYDISGGSLDDIALIGFTDTALTELEWAGAMVETSALLDPGDIIEFGLDTTGDGSADTTVTFTCGGSSITTIAGFLAALNDSSDGQFGGSGNANLQFFESAGLLYVRSLDENVDLINGSVTGAGAAASQLDLGTAFTSATASAVAANYEGTGVDALSGTRLAFTLDENPYIYEIDFVSNSLQAAIDLINETIGGSTDIASETLEALTLTSSFAGAASRVTINDEYTALLTNDNGDDAGTVLGLTGEDEQGAGRPNPDFYQDGSGTVYIGANILRNRSTGYPYSITSALADIYFDYVGLRLDVSPSASEPGLVSFTDVSTMIAAIGPVSTDNPLALACFLQLSNAPSQTVSVLGVSEVSAAAPMGTVTAYAEALDYLESKEVYAIAPLTDDPFVQQIFATHVDSMSQPEERGERIAFIWQGQPSRAVDESVQSGTDAETMGTDNSVLLGENPTSAIIAAGATDPSALTVDDGIYMELVIVDLGVTSVRNYSLESQNGVLTTFRTSFASGENDDGFFSTTTLEGDADLTGMSYSIRKRGDLLLVTGTEIPDYAAIAEAAAATGASYASRRVFHVYADSADTSVDGVVTNVPGYYICAAITGMVAEQAPQQPFTRLSMTGFSQVYGTDDTFGENQLDTIADGGRYVMINQGGRIASRHQRSTSSTSIESRELSITKAIDYLAKGLRATNRVYIGRFVINPGFIDQLVMSNEGFLARSVQSGVVNAASLKSVLQDESAPDTVLIEVEVAPAYPCNKIRITIVS